MRGRYSRINKREMITFSLVMMVAMLLTVLVYAEFKPGTKRTVAAGEELEIKGVILSRDGETFVLRDESRTDTVVLLTDSTDIKTKKKGLFRGGKEFDVTALVPGLILTVSGRGDAQGRLMAEKIRFKDTDYKAAVTSYAMTDPVDDKANKALEDAAQAQKAADEAAARISELDNYDVVKVVTVYFAVNKADLSAEAKASLDDAAKNAPTAKNYKIEVQGFTDSTGDFDKNLDLSRRRADSVVQYLAVMHNIPLRRITTPMGYGSTKTVADDKTAEGRGKNRRVEVRVLVNKGIATPKSDTKAETKQP